MVYNPLPKGEGMIGKNPIYFSNPLSLWERAIKKMRTIKIKLGEG